jgi:hypothetical protein
MTTFNLNLSNDDIDILSIYDTTRTCMMVSDHVLRHISESLRKYPSINDEQLNELNVCRQEVRNNLDSLSRTVPQTPGLKEAEVIFVNFHEITANYGDSVRRVFTVHMELSHDCFQSIGLVALVKLLAAFSRATLFSIARKLPHSFHLMKEGTCLAMTNIMLDKIQHSIESLPDSRNYPIKPEIQLFNIRLKIERRIIAKETPK